MTDALGNPDNADDFVIVEEPPENVEAPRRTTFLDAEPTPIEFGKRRTPKLEGELMALYGTLALAVSPFDPGMGSVIFENSEQCAHSLAELAKKNPRVKRVLESMLETSAWSAVIAAHLPIAVYAATKYIPTLRDKLEADARQAAQPE